MKKILSLIMASALSVSALTAMTSNADNGMLQTLDRDDTKFVQQYFQDYEHIEDKDGFFLSFTTEQRRSDYAGKDFDYQVFAKKVNYGPCEHYEYVMAFPGLNEITVKYDTSKFDINDYKGYTSSEITKILDEMGYDYTFKNVPFGTIAVSEDWNAETSIENAKLLCAELKETGLLTGFDYRALMDVENTFLNYPTGYSGYGISDEEYTKMLEDYIAEKNLDCKVMKISEFYEQWEEYCIEDCVCLVPNYDITAEEHLELSRQVYNDLGISPCSYRWETVETYAQEINMFDEPLTVTLAGDTNLDGAVNVADAIAVASFVANPEKNPLTEQQILNGDIDGSGLDANDVLAIQQYIAKIVETL